MPKPFTQYVKIKDHYCCSYLGESLEYLVFLRLLQSQIEEQLPGIKFWIGHKDGCEYLVGDKQVIPHSKLNYEDYCHVRELRIDNHYHSVLKLMEESQLEIKPVRVNKVQKKGLCLICPEGIPPVQSTAIAPLENMAVTQGYTPLVVGSDVHQSLKIKLRPQGKEKLDLLNEVGWVIGVENEYLALAGSLGIKTTLVKTGLGEKLFKNLFPEIELISTKL